MEADGLYDFHATAEDELSFEKGAIIKILNKQDGDWYQAEYGGRQGVVPRTYIKMREHDWYMGQMTRPNAENFLQKQKHDGAFLIRDSESSPGDFSLSVKYGDGVQHFKVLRDGDGKYFLWVVKFNSLNQLIDYHRTSSVSRTQTIYLKDSTVKKRYVTALYDFEAKEEAELSFARGDRIEVIDDEETNWWTGKLNGRQGLFPSTYVSTENS